MSVIKFDDERPHFERMASHWPRTIQDYWRQEEERQTNLPGKLLAEGMRLQAPRQQPAPRFAKRKTYQSPWRQDANLIRLRG